jgi:hypothetical protein
MAVGTPTGHASVKRLFFVSQVKLSAVFVTFGDLGIHMMWWEHEWASPKSNVWCELTSAGVIRPFFFHEKQ